MLEDKIFWGVINLNVSLAYHKILSGHRKVSQGGKPSPKHTIQANPLMIVSRKAKKKQAVRDERVCYFHVALL